MSLKHFSKRQGEILRLIATRANDESPTSTEEIASHVEVSVPTISRDMASLLEGDYVTSTGPGRGGGYFLTPAGRLLAPIDPNSHCGILDPDERFHRPFDMDLLRGMPNSLFFEEEVEKLRPLPPAKTLDMTKDTVSSRREIERFIIEMSWKSSSIEGNTYSLLDTEELITKGKEAIGKEAEEPIMILNHKYAFQFIIENRDQFQDNVSEAVLREVHSILIRDLNVETGLRDRTVSIGNTAYNPPDNKFQIQEAVGYILSSVKQAEDPHTAALTALAGLSYVQPFVDGNKRTSRMMANALLISRGQHPVSYRGVGNREYLSAVLTFYETGAISGLKNVFKKQYLFSRDHYGLRGPSVEPAGPSAGTSVSRPDARGD